MEYIADAEPDSTRPRYFFTTAAILPFLLVGIARGSTSRWGATTSGGSLHGRDDAHDLDPAALSGPTDAGSDHAADRSHGAAVLSTILLVAPALAVDAHHQSDLPAACGPPASGARPRSAPASPPCSRLTAVQWPFAEFLLTEPARNFLFAADQFGYDRGAGSRTSTCSGDSPMTAGVLWLDRADRGRVGRPAGLWWGKLDGAGAEVAVRERRFPPAAGMAFPSRSCGRDPARRPDLRRCIGCACPRRHVERLLRRRRRSVRRSRDRPDPRRDSRPRAGDGPDSEWGRRRAGDGSAVAGGRGTRRRPAARRRRARCRESRGCTAARLWLMTAGSYSVEVTGVVGAEGRGDRIRARARGCRTTARR